LGSRIVRLDSDLQNTLKSQQKQSTSIS